MTKNYLIFACFISNGQVEQRGGKDRNLTPEGTEFESYKTWGLYKAPVW